MDEDRPHKKAEAGAPTWVLTFADLMSLLLAFFVLLFSFSELDKLKYKQIAGSMREAFGVQREVKIKEQPKGINVVAREFSAGTPKPTAMNRVRQETSNVYRRHLKLPGEDASRPGDEVDDADKGKGKQTESAWQRRMQADAEKLRLALAEEVEQGLIEVATEGKKIVVRIREKGSFASGSAELVHGFGPVLLKMNQALSETRGKIIIAGHTDNVPIATERFRSNWELSAARAVTVMHELLDLSDIPPARFQISGYADTQPLDANDTYEGRGRNRRVEVAIMYGDDEEGETIVLGQEQAPAGAQPDGDE